MQHHTEKAHDTDAAWLHLKDQKSLFTENNWLKQNNKNKKIYFM